MTLGFVHTMFFGYDQLYDYRKILNIHKPNMRKYCRQLREALLVLMPLNLSPRLTLESAIIWK